MITKMKKLSFLIHSKEYEENLSKSSQKILKSLLEAREAAKKEEEAES